MEIIVAEIGQGVLCLGSGMVVIIWISRILEYVTLLL